MAHALCDGQLPTRIDVCVGNIFIELAEKRGQRDCELIQKGNEFVTAYPVAAAVSTIGSVDRFAAATIRSSPAE